MKRNIGEILQRSNGKHVIFSEIWCRTASTNQSALLNMFNMVFRGTTWKSYGAHNLTNWDKSNMINHEYTHMYSKNQEFMIFMSLGYELWATLLHLYDLNQTFLSKHYIACGSYWRFDDLYFHSLASHHKFIVDISAHVHVINVNPDPYKGYLNTIPGVSWASNH